MKHYNRHNFFKHTFCVFQERESLPHETPDYVSEKGSRYYFTDEGVYRVSNHWGRAANCRWPLVSSKHQSQQWSIGFALWINFFPNNEHEPLFFIEAQDHGFSYNHKNSAAYDGKAILRNAAATKKVLQQIHEIAQEPRWFAYFNESAEQLKTYFIDQLIHRSVSLHTLKAEKLKATK